MKSETSTVNFFQLQEKARRSTRFLVVWFALGIAGTALVLYAIVRFALTSSNIGSVTDAILTGTMQTAARTEQSALVCDVLLFLIILAGTVLFVGGISALKLLGFGKSTGADTAKALGGTEIRVGRERSLEERRLVNVVQEMSLASGVPVPRIFVLEKEPSINAFAAGMSTETAAVAVSRGALEKLSRSELQAVIGHEFSHILNGDMRLNMRLVGWIFGLVAISTVGALFLHAARFMPMFRSRDDKGAGASMMLLALTIGVVLLVVGWLSTVFAQIIQAAISRQRERLADASATQFTRNPQALANALSRIGGDALGSKLSSPRAQEFAHLFFAAGITSLFATHPPLEERIRALDPNWNGKFLPPLTKAQAAAEDNDFAGTNGWNGAFGEHGIPARRAVAAAVVTAAAASAATESSGTRPEKRTPRRRARNAFGVTVPALVFELSRSPDDAKALIYLLMMTDSPEQNVAQAKLLLGQESAELFKKMEKLWPQMAAFPPEKRIAGVLLAAPALRALDETEREHFCETLELLAEIDASVSLYELCILCAVRGLLLPFGEENLSGTEVAGELELVLNLFLVLCGLPRERHAEILAQALAAQPTLPQALRVTDAAEQAGAPAFVKAFEKLRCANILVRERAIAAARTIVAADGRETDEERDLLNAFAVAINCPLAPEKA